MATLVAFGERVRAARKGAGLTQQEVADAAGVHRVAISRIEAGIQDVGVTTLVDLASALGVSPGDLFVQPDQGCV